MKNDTARNTMDQATNEKPRFFRIRTGIKAGPSYVVPDKCDTTPKDGINGLEDLENALDLNAL